MYTLSINTEVPQIESRPNTPEHLDHDYWCMFCDLYYLAYGVMPVYNEELYDLEQETRFIMIRLLESGYTPKVEYVGEDTELVTDLSDTASMTSEISDTESVTSEISDYIHDVGSSDTSDCESSVESQESDVESVIDEPLTNTTPKVFDKSVNDKPEKWVLNIPSKNDTDKYQEYIDQIVYLLYLAIENKNMKLFDFVNETYYSHLDSVPTSDLCLVDEMCDLFVERFIKDDEWSIKLGKIYRFFTDTSGRIVYDLVRNKRFEDAGKFIKKSGIKESDYWYSFVDLVQVCGFE